jgi:hypothetical protein
LPCAKSKTLSTCSKGLKGYSNPPVNGGGGLNKMYLQTRRRYYVRTRRRYYYFPHAQGNQSGSDWEKTSGGPALLPWQLTWRAPRHLFWIPPYHTQCLRAGRVRIRSLPTNAGRVSGRELQPRNHKIFYKSYLYSLTHRAAWLLCKPGKWPSLNADVPFGC